MTKICAILTTMLMVAAFPVWAQECAQAPVHKVGDFIVRTNGLNQDLRREVVSVGQEIVMKDEKGRELRRTLEDNWLADWSFDRGDPITYAPHNHFFKFPICPGSEWGGRYEGKNVATSATWTSERRAKVAKAWTEVELAGKKLRVLEITYTFIPNVSRVRGNVEATCLYSPEVKANIRCRSTEPRFDNQITSWGSTAGVNK